MRNVTSAFRRALMNDKRNYNIDISATLANGTELTLNNASIWDNGFSLEDSVSADNVFQIGAAIINKATIVINNIYDNYSEYDFADAKTVVEIGLSGLDDGSTDKVRMGEFTVDEAQYNGSLIALTCLDNMHKFDKAYVDANGNPPLTYPATLEAIVLNACTKCGVSMDNASLQFPHRDYVVSTAPSGEATTYRQVISWAAQIAGCFARINSSGKLTFSWYDMDTIQEYMDGLDGGTFDAGSSSRYTTGDTADGGTFNPWNTGYAYDAGTFRDQGSIHVIASTYNSQISTDDVVITGVSVQKKLDDGGSSYQTYSSGTAGYVIAIEGNEFIQGTHGQDVANWLGTQLIGLTFRKANITHPNDPSIEAGDVALLVDRKGNTYPIIISSTTFNINSSQSTASSAETPRKNSAQRFTDATRNYVELRKRLEKQKTSFEEAQEELAERLEHASGLYTTPVTKDGSTIYYYHDKPLLGESNIVMEFSDVGFTLTNNYQKGSQATWYGMTVDGTMISSILNTIGVKADWIRTGTLDASKATITNINATNIKTGSMSADLIKTGTMSADRIEGGTLSLGGSNGALGVLEILNAGSMRLVYSDAEGYKVINGGAFASLTEDVFTDYQDVSVLRNSALELGWLASGTLINSSNFHTNGKMRLIRDDNSIAYVSDVTRIDLSFNRPESEMLTLGYYDNSGTPVPMIILQTLSNSYSGIDQRYPILDALDQAHYTAIVATRDTGIDGSMHVAKNFYVYGNKNRVISTPDYGNRLQYAYETASPYFGDIGTAKTDEQGSCYVFLDDILRETINTNHEYSVFLQEEGEGKVWVAEKTADYFVVKGTANLPFSWELKAKQVDHTDTRLELLPNEEIEDIDYAAEGAALIGEDIDYAAEAAAMVDEYFSIAEV